MKNFHLLLTATLLLICVQTARAQTSTDSGELNDAQLSQSIRDRIQKIATQSANLTATKKIAITGSLQKIASDTLTIKTKQDIRLASISAETTFARFPANQSATFQDLSIDNYIVAMGFINGSQVLETRRVLIFNTEPEATKKASIAGIIKYIDEAEDAIILVANGQEIQIDITATTTLELQSGVERTELELTDLSPGQYIAAVYLPAADSYTNARALTVLATSIFRPIPDIIPTPAISESATPSVTTPPELGN